MGALEKVNKQNAVTLSIAIPALSEHVVDV